MLQNYIMFWASWGVFEVVTWTRCLGGKVERQSRGKGSASAAGCVGAGVLR